MENGVKNLKGARLFPKTFSNNGYGDAYKTPAKIDRVWFLCNNLQTGKGDLVHENSDWDQERRKKSMGKEDSSDSCSRPGNGQE